MILFFQKSFLAILGLFIFFLFGANFVNADSSFSLKPAKQEIAVDPGQTVSGHFSITNNLGYDAVFLLSVEDLAWQDKNFPVLTESNPALSRFSLSLLLRVPTEKILIKTNETKKIVFSITAPANLPPGGYYGSIVISAQTASAKNKTRFNSRVASLVLLTVKGENLTKGEITGFGLIGRDFILGQKPVNFYLSFANDGNIHLNPYGLLEIKNWFGQRVALLEIKPWTVLPESTRLLETAWSETTSAVGRLTATVYLNRGYQDIVDQKSFSFWVVPWWFLFSLLAIVGLLVIALKLRK